MSSEKQFLNSEKQSTKNAFISPNGNSNILGSVGQWETNWSFLIASELQYNKKASLIIRNRKCLEM